MMRMKMWKIGLAGLMCLLSVSLAASAGWTQTASEPPAAAAPPAPTEPRPIQCGPLEITPLRASLILSPYNPTTIELIPLIRFQIRNTSPADVKIIIFASTLGATEPNGQKLFPDDYDHFSSYGIMLSKQPPESLGKAFVDEGGKFVTLAPQQSFEAQISVDDGRGRSLEDKNNELMLNFRPKEITLSAAIGIINLDGTTEKRAFSFSHLPIQVTTR